MGGSVKVRLVPPPPRLQEHEVEKMFTLKPGRLPQADVKNVIFFVRPKLELMDIIADNVLRYRWGGVALGVTLGPPGASPERWQFRVKLPKFPIRAQWGARCRHQNHVWAPVWERGAREGRGVAPQLAMQRPHAPPRGCAFFLPSPTRSALSDPWENCRETKSPCSGFRHMDVSTNG